MMVFWSSSGEGLLFSAETAVSPDDFINLDMVLKLEE